MVDCKPTVHRSGKYSMDAVIADGRNPYCISLQKFVLQKTLTVKALIKKNSLKRRSGILNSIDRQEFILEVYSNNNKVAQTYQEACAELNPPIILTAKQSRHSTSWCGLIFVVFLRFWEKLKKKKWCEQSQSTRYSLAIRWIAYRILCMITVRIALGEADGAVWVFFLLGNREIFIIDRRFGFIITMAAEVFEPPHLDIWLLG